MYGKHANFCYFYDGQKTAKIVRVKLILTFRKTLFLTMKIDTGEYVYFTESHKLVCLQYNIFFF